MGDNQKGKTTTNVKGKVTADKLFAGIGKSTFVDENGATVTVDGAGAAAAADIEVNFTEEITVDTAIIGCRSLTAPASMMKKRQNKSFTFTAETAEEFEGFQNVLEENASNRMGIVDCSKLISSTYQLLVLQEIQSGTTKVSTLIFPNRATAKDGATDALRQKGTQFFYKDDDEERHRAWN